VTRKKITEKQQGFYQRKQVYIYIRKLDYYNSSINFRVVVDGGGGGGLVVGTKKEKWNKLK
jgi:hypothetical protein